jgi:hypothetical protein
MSLRNRIILPLAISALIVLAGCGTSNTIANPVAPPTGSFSASSLNGAYVFSVSGVDLQGAPYVLLGSFTANGQGGITGGTVDISDFDLTATVPNSAIGSNSTYKVNVDGRGQASLANSVLGTISLDFVLQDSAHGLVTEFDTNATGSGTLDLQSAGVSPTGSYAFSFSGSDTNGALLGTIGNFTVGSNGAISGLEDVNDGEFAVPNESLSGSLVVGPSSTPSTVLTAGTGLPVTFDVFAIDATHLKFIEMDGASNLLGDAYSQTSTAFPTGTLAFTFQGSFPGNQSPAAAGGFMVSDGAGNLTSASTVDANNAGTVSPQPLLFTGTYASAGTGRYTLALSSFTDGTAYVAYPFNGGVFLLESDDSGVMLGAAFPQSSTTLATSEGYGLNFTGANLTNSVEVDDIAEFSADGSGNATGIVDENFQPGGGPNLGLTLTGTYAPPDSNGRGQVAANAGTSTKSTLNGGFLINYYSVDGVTFPFIETDTNGQVTTGVFFKQTPTSSSSAAASAAMAKSHMFVMPRIMKSRIPLKKKM